MKNIYLSKRVIPVVVGFCGLLVLFGCSNPLSPPRAPANHTPESELGTGTLMLTINGAARTIVPIWREQGDFVFSLAFAAANGDVGFEIDWDGQSPIVMAVGDWNLSVRAYLPGVYVAGSGYGEPRLAAQGAYADTITIQGGTPAGANIVLRPIPVAEGPGMGTFAWYIDLSDIYDNGASFIRMRVVPLEGGATVFEDEFNLPSSPRIQNGIWADRRVLESGWYIVTLVLYKETNDGPEYSARNAVLRVYQYLYSVFDGDGATFTRLDFPASLLNVILRSWDTGSRTWNFPDTLTYQHFLAADIDGVTAGNFFNDTGYTGCISYWLNRLTTEPPVDWGELQDLIDEALDAARGGTLTIQFDWDTRPEDSELAGMFHEVTLTGSGETLTRSFEGAGPASMSIPAGRWYITIRSEGDRLPILDDDVFPARMVRAIGGTSVEVISGQSTSADIAMISAVGVASHEQLEEAFRAADELNQITIALLDDITFSGTPVGISIPAKDITLVSDTNVRISRGTLDGEMFYLDSGRLTLGRPGMGGTITLDGGGTTSAGPIIRLIWSGNLVMHDGVILTGNNSTVTGGAVLVEGEFDRFYMHGGTITGNTATSGGGVHVEEGTFIMSGGSITGNYNNTNAPGEWADVAMSGNTAVTTLSGTARIGVIRLSLGTRVAIGAGWTGNIGRLDLADNAQTMFVGESWTGMTVLSGSGGHTLTAGDVLSVALGYFVSTLASADPPERITGLAIGLLGADLGILIQGPPNIAMVRIDGGAFQMGSPEGTPDSNANERPVRQVTLSDFYMSRFQVTQGQWFDVMSHLQSGPGAGTRRPSFFEGTGNADGVMVSPTFEWRNLPVESVNWYDALVFSNRLSMQRGLTPAYSIGGSTDPAEWGTVPTSPNATWDAVTIVPGSTGYRLPTEAQWEFAARGGIVCQGNYAFSGSNTAAVVAWYSGNSGRRTHPVGTREPNALGLYDMSGNVWEWVWDWFGDYPDVAQTDPTGPAAGDNRVVRGGRWGLTSGHARSASRDYGLSDHPPGNLGFRLVRPDPLASPPATTVSVSRDGGPVQRFANLADALASVTDTAPHTITLYENQQIVTWPLLPNQHITLRGAGHTVNLGGNGSLFTVANGATLTLGNITLAGHNTNTAPLVRVMLGGTLYMNEGSAITGNRNTGFGGGVLNDGTFTMHNGRISGNISDSSGGGVWIQPSATFTMHNGEISDNYARGVGDDIGNGGGVAVNNGTFIMDGGTITSNTAIRGGGGVVVGGEGTFTMSGGTISGNTANLRGGGVYVGGNATFRISNGTIFGADAAGQSANSVTGTGAALHMNPGETGTAQHGTFDDFGAFDSMGNLLSGTDFRNDTISITNGVPQQ